MLHAVATAALFACAPASRVHVHENAKSQTKFGASCDDLQTMFGDRVSAFQRSLATLEDSDTTSRFAQARTLMRTYGVIRTLRRAKDCDWVVQNDSEELEQLRGIVQTLLADNPCADAARSELAAGMSAENSEIEMASIRRAMLVLTSDTCEVAELQEHIEDSHDTLTMDERIAQTEDDLQDALYNMEEEGNSLIETKSEAGSARSFLRRVGVIFLMIFLLLACVGAAVAVSVLLGLVVMFTYELVAYRGAGCQGPGCLGLLLFPLAGLYGGGALGLVGCAYQLYSQMFRGQLQ